MNLSKLMRPEIKNFQPYLPGKPMEEVRRELGLKKIVKLASNENGLGTSKKVTAALSRGNDNLFRYPESSGTPLRRALAKHCAVREGEVILGAGSDELIEVIGKTFFNRNDEVIVSEHAFVRYRMAADLMGAKTIPVPMKNFTHDLNGMLRKITRKTKAIFIANPNNPTGTYVSRKEVNQFFSQLSTLNSKLNLSPLIIFDEAYYEYSKYLAPDYPETLDFFRKNENLIVLRTFSKIYGLAGLRIGYGIAHQKITEALDRVRPPFNVSSIAQRAALAALSDPAHVKKSAETVKKGMETLVQELEKMNLSVVPSAGNFLMVDCSPRKGREIFQQLLRRGAIVRAVDEYEFPNHIRVTIGLPEENRFFIQQFKEVLKKR